METADQASYFPQSQHPDTGPTSLSTVLVLAPGVSRSRFEPSSCRTRDWRLYHWAIEEAALAYNRSHQPWTHGYGNQSSRGLTEGRVGNGRGGGGGGGEAARNVWKAASSHSTQFWPPPSQYNNDNDDDDHDDGDDDDDDDDNDDDDNDSGLFCSLHPTPRNASYIHAHFSKVKSRATFRPFFCLSFLFLSFILIVWLVGWLFFSTDRNRQMALLLCFRPSKLP